MSMAHFGTTEAAISTAPLTTRIGLWVMELMSGKDSGPVAFNDPSQFQPNPGMGILVGKQGRCV